MNAVAGACLSGVQQIAPFCKMGFRNRCLKAAALGEILFNYDELSNDPGVHGLTPRQTGALVATIPQRTPDHISRVIIHNIRSKDMKTLLFAAMAAASVIPAAAMAQDDASSARRIEPYVGVLGGVDNYDSEGNKAGIPAGYHGRIVEGVAGVNYNVAGPIVVGVEGNATKGVDGAIDWEYGAAGRVGVKAGKDSMFFGKVGYQWVNFDALGKDSPDFHGTTYGAGVELSAADMGLSKGDSSNIRLRVQADTMGNFNSIRPMAGVVAKF
jgi:outer membrane immunogenic protein